MLRVSLPDWKLPHGPSLVKTSSNMIQPSSKHGPDSEITQPSRKLHRLGTPSTTHLLTHTTPTTVLHCIWPRRSGLRFGAFCTLMLQMSSSEGFRFVLYVSLGLATDFLKASWNSQRIHDIWYIQYIYTLKKKIYIYTIFLQTYLYTYKLTAISGCAEGLRRCCKGGRGVRKTPWLHDHDHDDLRHLVYKKIGQFLLRFQHELRNIEMQAQPPTFFGLKRCASRRSARETDSWAGTGMGQRYGKDALFRCFPLAARLCSSLSEGEAVRCREESNAWFFATWTYQYHSTAQDFEQSTCRLPSWPSKTASVFSTQATVFDLVTVPWSWREMGSGWESCAMDEKRFVSQFSHPSSVFEWLPFTWTHIMYFSVYTSQNLLFHSHQLPCARWPWSSPTRWWWASALISILRALLGMSQKWILGRKPIAVKRQHREPNLKRGPLQNSMKTESKNGQFQSHRHISHVIFHHTFTSHKCQMDPNGMIFYFSRGLLVFYCWSISSSFEPKAAVATTPVPQIRWDKSISRLPRIYIQNWRLELCIYYIYVSASGEPRRPALAGPKIYRHQHHISPNMSR